MEERLLAVPFQIFHFLCGPKASATVPLPNGLMHPQSQAPWLNPEFMNETPHFHYVTSDIWRSCSLFLMLMCYPLSLFAPFDTLHRRIFVFGSFSVFFLSRSSRHYTFEKTHLSDPWTLRYDHVLDNFFNYPGYATMHHFAPHVLESVFKNRMFCIARQTLIVQDAGSSIDFRGSLYERSKTAMANKHLV